MNNTVLIALIAFICSSFTAIVIALFKYTYLSKCFRVKLCSTSCCQCLEYDRDVQHEQKINTDVQIPVFDFKKVMQPENIEI